MQFLKAGHNCLAFMLNFSTKIKLWI